MTAFASVSELADQIRGVSYTKEEASPTPGPGYLPILRAGNITDDGLSFDDLVYVPSERITPNQKIRTHDVLIATSSGSLDVVGKAARARTAFDGAFGAFCKVLRPRSNVDPVYFGHYFRTSRYRRLISAVAAGANINNLRNEHLDRLEVPLPPRAEQRRIAQILDKADALRTKRRAAIAQLDTLTQSIFLDMFGDPATNPMGWPTERMESIMTIRRGGSPRPIENYLGGDINWIKIGDGTQGSDIYLERCAEKITRDGLKKTLHLKPGSLIFANCGVSLGFARILKIDGCIHDGWLSFEDISESKLDKLFLLKALNSITDYFRRIAPSGTQPNLNTGLMKNFRMILPPLALQKKFAGHLEALEQLKLREKASLADLESLFSSLQHRAFNQSI